MNLNAIAYNIAAALGLPRDEAAIRRIKFTVHYYRELLIRRDMDRNVGVSAALVQSIPKVVVSPVPVTGTDVDVTVFGQIYRTKDKVPRPIRLKYREGFQYVGAIDRKTPFTEINPFELAWIADFKYTAKLPRFFYQDSYIYIVNVTPENIRIEALFADPTEIPGYEDENYPITGDLVKYITEGLAKGEFVLQGTEDGRIKINE